MANYIAKDIADRYTVASQSNSTNLDLSKCQVYEVDNSSPLTLNMLNFPNSSRAETIVIDAIGNSGITFTVPDGITLTWNTGQQPQPGDIWTQYVFIFTGSRLRGGVGYFE